MVQVQIVWEFKLLKAVGKVYFFGEEYYRPLIAVLSSNESSPAFRLEIGCRQPGFNGGWVLLL